MFIIGVRGHYIPRRPGFVENPINTGLFHAATLTITRGFTMQISGMQDLHSGSYQRKPGFLGCMQFDHIFAVLSILVSISLHRRLDISIQPAFSQFLLLLLLLLLLLVVDSHRFLSILSNLSKWGNTKKKHK
jgi:hypothetical protein